MLLYPRVNSELFILDLDSRWGGKPLQGTRISSRNFAPSGVHGSLSSILQIIVSALIVTTCLGPYPQSLNPASTLASRRSTLQSKLLPGAGHQNWSTALLVLGMCFGLSWSEPSLETQQKNKYTIMIIYPYASSDRRNELDTGMNFKLTEKYQIGVPGVGIQIQNAFALICNSRGWNLANVVQQVHRIQGLEWQLSQTVLACLSDDLRESQIGSWQALTIPKSDIRYVVAKFAWFRHHHFQYQQLCEAALISPNSSKFSMLTAMQRQTNIRWKRLELWPLPVCNVCSVCLSVCLSGCMDVWMYGCMDECMSA